MDERNELLQDFLIESQENLERLDGELVALEENPQSQEILSSIFRTVHTIKGTCGFLELCRLERVTHAGENLLSLLRDGTLKLNGSIATGLLGLIDTVRQMLEHLAATGTEGEEDYDDLIAKLSALQSGEEGPVDDCEAVVDSAEDPIAPSAEARPEKDSTPKPGGDSGEGGGSLLASSIRIQVEQLDKLMNLVGELVLARNQILQNNAASQDTDANATLQRLSLVTSELQEGIMKVRMQPVGSLWRTFPRVVRDLSKQLGKRVRFEMAGRDTELDKSLLEAIKDPLTHLVRNAVDHGIETPEVRAASGKPAVGTVVLRAFHESGQVNIEIIDDGKGISAPTLVAKAIEKGILTREEAAGISDRRALNLIFAAGFSTATQVTNVSGRGVGMDVVKTNIERIGGIVEISTEIGRGTTMRIKIPLTLAIIPALIVTTAGDRFAIPQVCLVELVRLEHAQVRERIETLYDSPVYRLRGELLPLVYLDRELGIAPAKGADLAEKDCNIVVVRADDQQFGLVVDEINDTEEIVVKPLDRQLKQLRIYAGTTILGDGAVALIIDMLGLAQAAGVVGEDRRAGGLPDFAESGSSETTGASSYLLLAGGGGRRMAVELAGVSRLEEFPIERIERTGPFEVVQYRGAIMPLVRLSQSLGLPAQSDGELLQVVVHTRNGMNIGLVVDGILDIVTESAPVSHPSTTPGIRAALVLDGKVADLLDVEALVAGIGQPAAREDRDPQHAAQSSRSAVRQLCTFYLGNLCFGVDVQEVQEVLRHQDTTRVPRTSRVVHGLINLRGQTVTALDMRARLGLPALDLTLLDEDGLPMNLLLRSHGGVVSVLVDRIGDVLSMTESDLAEVPATLSSNIRDLVCGVFKLQGQLLLLLDTEELLNVSALAA